MLRRTLAALLVLCLTFPAVAGCGAPATAPPQPTPAATATTVAGPLPTVLAPPETAGLQPGVTPTLEALASELDTLLVGLEHEGRLSGSVLVAQGNHVVLSRGYGQADRERGIANTPQTRYRLGSVTKQFTAMAILTLQSQEKLAAQDGICRYLADCPAAWQEITIHQLLTHTSGIPNYVMLPGYGRTRATPAAPGELIARFRDLPLEFSPGTQFGYSNSGYVLLGVIIEVVSGESYEAFLQEHLFARLGMADSGYEHDWNGLAIGYADATARAEPIDMSIPFAAGGLYSTVEDLYRWDRGLMEGELPADTMFTPYVSTPSLGGAGYGYGWYIGEVMGHRWIGHSGKIEGFATLNSWFPDEQMVVIVLMNREDLKPAQILEQIAGLLNDRGFRR